MFARPELKLNELLYFPFTDAYSFVSCIYIIIFSFLHNCVFCMQYLLPFGVKRIIIDVDRGVQGEGACAPPSPPPPRNFLEFSSRGSELQVHSPGTPVLAHGQPSDCNCPASPCV